MATFNADISICSQCLTAELLVLRGEHKSLGDDVKVFDAVHLLHPLDVFVQAILPRQFVRPEKEKSSSSVKNGGKALR